MLNFTSGLLFLINYICQLDEIKFCDSPSLAVAAGVEKCALQTCGVRSSLRGFDIQLSLVRQKLAKS